MGDGMLRTLEQTIQITQQMWDKERSFVVVNLQIPEEEVYSRLAKRAREDGTNSRNDDIDMEAIKNRIQAFHTGTQPALDWVNEQGLLVNVDGMRNEQEIFAEILDIIK